MEGADLALLVAVAFATAIVSSILGMAGGVALLAVMVIFLDPLVAIPLHGAIQLVSNASRTWIQRGAIHWGILARFAIPLVPAGIAGLALARALPAEAVRVAIGAFVLLVTWAPQALGPRVGPGQPRLSRRFLALGGAVGFLNTTIGATGPLLAPFFLNLSLARQAVIGTKAACQSLGHGVKIALFGAAGFAFADHALLLASAAAAVVGGTWVGSRLLEGMSEASFTKLYKVVLTLVALRLLAGELLGG
jgi:uncharacterized protein